jgi:hypothetical protein
MVVLTKLATEFYKSLGFFLPQHELLIHLLPVPYAQLTIDAVSEYVGQYTWRGVTELPWPFLLFFYRVICLFFYKGLFLASYLYWLHSLCSSYAGH